MHTKLHAEPAESGVIGLDTQRVPDPIACPDPLPLTQTRQREVVHRRDKLRLVPQGLLRRGDPVLHTPRLEHRDAETVVCPVVGRASFDQRSIHADRFDGHVRIEQ